MDEDESQPLDLSWPDSWRERATYLMFLPIIIPLWITLPDTRKQSGIRFYKDRNSSSKNIHTQNRKGLTSSTAKPPKLNSKITSLI